VADEEPMVFGEFTLFPFQAECVRKLAPVRASLIGDDMGLGKTAEALGLDILRRQNIGRDPYANWDARRSSGRRIPTLVIAPLSPLSDAWAGTIPKMAPEARFTIIDPKKRWSFLDDLKEGQHDYYLIHWQGLRFFPELAELSTIGRAGWFNVIADEVHRAKNRKAVQTCKLKILSKYATYKTGLSGTPADNKPADLWSILHWLYPDKYTSYWRFFNRHTEFKVKETQEGRKYKKISGVKNLGELHTDMARYYVRRRKEDPAINLQLPAKYYSTWWVDLSPTQRRAYDQMRKNMLAWVGENEDTPLVAPVAISKLVRLQQFSVAHVDARKVWKWKKVRFEIATDPDQVDFILKTTKPEHIQWDRGLIHRIYTEVQETYNIEPSSKCDAAMEWLEDSGDQPLVVFTQFRGVVFLLRERLRNAGIRSSVLVGGMSPDERGLNIEAFQTGDTRVFVSTIASGGEGITLTAASTMMFLDREWSPSHNRQAEDREHRIGQKDAVHVIDVMARNTVDLGRNQDFKAKWTWLQMMLGDKVMDYQLEETGRKAA
jgi:SNF2 family DNA or RNA helicase